jgi:hypothetical protein
MNNDRYVCDADIRDAEIALKDDPAWCNEIFQIINNEYIRDMAVAFDSESVYLEAINQMVNDEFIRDVAIASNMETVYIEAINKILNDEYIRDIAIASNMESVCNEAIKQIVNDDCLLKVRKKLNTMIAERERKERERKRKERAERERIEKLEQIRWERERPPRKKAEKERLRRDLVQVRAEIKTAEYYYNINMNIYRQALNKRWSSDINTREDAKVTVSTYGHFLRSEQRKIERLKEKERKILESL